MKLKIVLFLQMTLFISCFTANAQIDSLIVEKYYVSDAMDATDTLSGGLPENSIAYRVFINLTPGYILKEIFGSEFHPLSFSSTENFFNNLLLGKSFGYQINKNNLDNNTTALDTWITLGFASNKHFGVLKSQDTDGSIVGGMNNDGGSSNIPGGLLVNDDVSSGIPLTSEDGLVPTDSSTSAFFQTGFLNEWGEDSTIFGLPSDKHSFVSNSVQLLNYNGIPGTGEQNNILVAQLTTRGEISFKLNLVVENAEGQSINIVADDPTGDEQTSRFLTWPLPPPPEPACGCKDADYIEYNADLECHDEDSCKTLIVYGCMDPYACNFNPDANFNISGMCCFPGHCNDRDIHVVCPSFDSNILELSVYPNPVSEILNLVINRQKSGEMNFIVYDSFGNPVLEEYLHTDTGVTSHQLDISLLSGGVYLLRLFDKDQSITKSFIKE
jgi:hypothetical protein